MKRLLSFLLRRTKKEPVPGFYGLGIAPKLLETLDKLKFKEPTPIQKQAIPIACEGKDLVGIAQTGTGKTLAFAIPMIQTLAAKPGKGLVLVPTRELAQQVNEVFHIFAPKMGMASVCLIGGESMSRQLADLRKKPRIIIATPGRLLDHMEHGAVRLNDVHMAVLDEADRMLDMGFMPQIERVLRAVPKQRQTMLFSATIPDEVMRLAGGYMKLPIRIEVARSGTAAEHVIQEVYVVTKGMRPALLSKLLDKYWGTVLLFVRTRHDAATVTRFLREIGHNAAEIHSDRTQAQRNQALEGFKSGKYRILVATDIAARGIDVTGIELVVNYGLPDDDDNYIHRIGRTGRAGHGGRAVSLVAPEEEGELRNIERLMQKQLPIVTHPDIPEAKFGSVPPMERMKRYKAGPPSQSKALPAGFRMRRPSYKRK
ncbi:MAG: DEAD/DEAH box helicase [Elusimicrobia bacterium]|nr:DEAD/DEAH box helicase [Elusimicrobiota bacterium]